MKLKVILKVISEAFEMILIFYLLQPKGLLECLKRPFHQSSQKKLPELFEPPRIWHCNSYCNVNNLISSRCLKSDQAIRLIPRSPLRVLLPLSLSLFRGRRMLHSIHQHTRVSRGALHLSELSLGSIPSGQWPRWPRFPLPTWHKLLQRAHTSPQAKQFQLLRDLLLSLNWQQLVQLQVFSFYQIFFR